MKHKHYEMIVAKAVNMDLVVFRKETSGKWLQVAFGKLCMDMIDEFFLCLPQHENACLHWLDGGVSQLEYTHQSYPTWNDIDNEATDWGLGHVFMDRSLKIRIKPQKVKRWIAFSKDKTMERVCVCESEESALSFHDGWQIIEIEVEV